MLTSVEFDHADIYRDLDHVKSAFRALVVPGCPPTAPVVAANRTTRACATWLADAPCRVVGYGLEEDGATTGRARNVVADAEGHPLRGAARRGTA